MGLGKHRTKNWYQTKIHRLTVQRDLIRKTFKVKNGAKASEWYHRAVAPINLKIRSYQKQIRRFEIRMKPVQILAEQVRKFTGISGLYQNARSMDKDQVNARRLFYKRGLEKGIQARYLIAFTGASRTDVALRARRSFTKSFKTKPENKQLWYNFQQFIKDNHGNDA